MAKVAKWIYWTPRILSILFICFLALFSLDVFESASGFWQIALALLMHNIPALVLLALTIVAWRYEIVGAVTYFLAGIVYIALLLVDDLEPYKLGWAVQISGPAFLTGYLFLKNWKQKRKK